MEPFITNLIPADKLIHMTVTYSNAVLMLVLTNVSDFARKLDLAVPQPVATVQVEKFFVAPVKGTVGGVLTLTNGDRFHYDQGYIHSFYSHDDDPFPDKMEPAERHRLWTAKFRGQMNMTTNEVVEFARESLRKLGYDPKSIGADNRPTRFDGPFTPEDEPDVVIPRCNLEWRDKRTRNHVSFRIDAEKKRVIRVILTGPYFRKSEPQLSVEPELERDFRQRTEGKIFTRTNAPPRLPFRPSESD